MPGTEKKKAQDRERMQNKRRAEKEVINAANWLNEMVEGISGAIEHGTWRDEKGRRLKDTPQWVQFYVSLKRVGRSE